MDKQSIEEQMTKCEHCKKAEVSSSIPVCRPCWDEILNAAEAAYEKKSIENATILSAIDNGKI